MALRYDVSIRSITLWLFGGVASFEAMPRDWRTELAIAVAGPAVSVVVGVVAALAFLVVPGGDSLVSGAALSAQRSGTSPRGRR